MDYQLFDKKDATRALATAAFADDFAAEKWARDWAATQGTSDDYLIRQTCGDFSAQLFRTVGGQWFIMRQ